MVSRRICQKSSFFILETSRSINQRRGRSRDKLNIDSTPRARTLSLAMNMFRAPIKINASIRTDSAIGALMRCMLCVNARGDEDKYLY